MVAPAFTAQNVKNKIYMKFGSKFYQLIFSIICLLMLHNCGFNKVSNFFNSSPKENISDTEFVEGSDDIPLFSSLKKFGEEGVDFDSASGSISSLIYESSADLNKVRNFYVKTMPQMGWRIHQNGKKKLVFHRQKQKLEIELIVENGKNLVKFFILE
jgi:hypothetical protein